MSQYRSTAFNEPCMLPWRTDVKLDPSTIEEVLRLIRVYAPLSVYNQCFEWSKRFVAT